jgi:hypothetical protein
MKIAIKDLTLDRSIYPRKNLDDATVKAYRAARDAGAEFPPGEVQRVVNYDPDDPEKEFILIVDCAHRASAATEHGFDKPLVDEVIEVEYWRDEVLDYTERWQELAERGLELAKRQPKNLLLRDKRDLCRRMAERDEKMKLTEEMLAELFQVPRQTMHDWVHPTRARQRASRESVILRLHLLGWTQEEIGQAVGLSQPQVKEIIGNADFGKTDSFLAKGKSVEEVADILGYDLTLAWALRLRDMSDQEIAEAVEEEGELEGELGFKIIPHDYWPPGGMMELAGLDHPGRIPGRIVMNTLYFFTERGDVVLDPMAGGGVTADCCLLMGRACYSYDIDLRHGRPDILEWDLAEGWPDRIKKADLIFWDPPYFDKMDDDYPEGSISSMERGEYLSFLAHSLSEAKSSAKKGARLAFLMSDWTPGNDDDPDSGIFLWHYAGLIEDAGWTILRHIQRPLPLTQIHPDIAIKLRDEKRLSRLNRYLLVAEA